MSYPFNPSKIVEEFDNFFWRLTDTEEVFKSLDQDEVDDVDKLRLELVRTKGEKIYGEYVNLLKLVEEFTIKGNADIDKVLDKYFEEIPMNLK